MALRLPSRAEVREAAKRASANLTVTTVTPNVDVNGKPEHAPEEPLFEHPSQRYNPYRGEEMHGVEPGQPWDGGPQGFTDGTVDVHWDTSDPDSHVVPVRIVKDDDETLRKWRAVQVSAPAAGSPQQLVNRNTERTKLTIKNITTTGQVLWVGEDNNTGPFNGYPLNANETLSLESTGVVYMVSSDANPCPVAWIVEYTQRVKV